MHRAHAEPPPGRGRHWRTILSLLPYLGEYRGRVAFAMGCLLLAKLANVAVPLLLREIVDALDASQQAVLVLPLALLLGYGALRITHHLFGELRDAVFAKVTQHAIRRIALKVFAHLHTLSLRFHLERKTGAISRDIERGSRGIHFLLNFMLFNILPTLVEFALVAAILWALYDAWFALITLASVTVYIAFTLIVTEWRIKYRRAMNELDSKANTRAIDSLLNYETVKCFGNEDYEARRYDENLAQWEQAAIKNQTSLAALNFGQGVIIAIGLTVLLIRAAEGVVGGALSLGDLVAINTYLLQLFIPLNFLGFVYREIKHALVDMDRMFGLLEQPAEIRDVPDALSLRLNSGAIRFAGVDFGYQPERPILHQVDFEVPAGSKVAVVGPSGAGKSTLARLLFRFYDVGAGTISIDGQDIRAVTQASLRAAIGIVPQDCVLFNDSIYYNIAYARPEAAREEVLRAAEVANIHHFVESLPQGYDTLVGERGLKLSGGEKQRIAIARAVLKKPRILIFDEATASLDSRSERAILGALREAAAGHTTLAIAHRLSTIVDADQILVVEHGRIAERGTHRELLAQNGIYAHMWTLQQAEQVGAQPVEAAAT